MKKENFILVSLKDEGSKKLAQSISNETCRRILNYLSEKDSASESDIADILGMPISTAHYNLQLLKDNGLVEVKEFHYSKKGREISHYSLANKMIIIAPRGSEKFLDKIKSLIPVAIIVAVIGGLMRFFTEPAIKNTVLETSFFPSIVNEAPSMMQKIAMDSQDSMAEASNAMVQEVVNEAEVEALRTTTQMAINVTNSVPLDQTNQTVTNVISETVKIPFFNHTAVWWFLIGAVITLILILIFWSLRRRR